MACCASLLLIMECNAPLSNDFLPEDLLNLFHECPTGTGSTGSEDWRINPAGMLKAVLLVL